MLKSQSSWSSSFMGQFLEDCIIKNITSSSFVVKSYDFLTIYGELQVCLVHRMVVSPYFIQGLRTKRLDILLNICGHSLVSSAVSGRFNLLTSRPPFERDTPMNNASENHPKTSGSMRKLFERIFYIGLQSLIFLFFKNCNSCPFD